MFTSFICQSAVCVCRTALGISIRPPSFSNSFPVPFVRFVAHLRHVWVTAKRIRPDGKFVCFFREKADGHSVNVNAT